MNDTAKKLTLVAGKSLPIAVASLLFASAPVAQPVSYPSTFFKVADATMEPDYLRGSMMVSSPNRKESRGAT